MSISYDMSNGMVLSTPNPSDNITIGYRNADTIVNNCVISSSDITYNVPIQLPYIIPTINMIGYTYSTRTAQFNSLPANSSSVINLATFTLNQGIYLLKACVIVGSGTTSTTFNRIAFQFNDISSNVIDTSGIYGGFIDYSQTSCGTNLQRSTELMHIQQTTTNIYLNFIININNIFSVNSLSSYTITRIA